jgi:hypothetical protein
MEGVNAVGTFLESEKLRQVRFKATSPYFSEPAHADGVYKGRPRPFCLPRAYADENLFPDIRHSAPAYFAAHGIKWHDGQNNRPSNHLCDSQVCCVNFLFPFADSPEALTHLLRPILPDVQEMLPVEDGHYVAFEWIGQENYLNEKIPRGGKRTRGANFTSADAAVMFERRDGRRQFVLIEWKYTESNSGKDLRIAKSGTDRRDIYRPLFERDDCPINRELLPDFDSLFYEPFDQLMRQQLLAHEMERQQEACANTVSVLHIAPEHNIDFRRVTSPSLQQLGTTAIDVWTRLVRLPYRFLSVSTESLFGGLSAEELPGMREWLEYIMTRYSWLGSDEATTRVSPRHS